MANTPTNWLCAICKSDQHPPSAMQPAMCIECIDMTLKGHSDQIVPRKIVRDPVTNMRRVALVGHDEDLPECTDTQPWDSWVRQTCPYIGMEVSVQTSDAIMSGSIVSFAMPFIHIHNTTMAVHYTMISSMDGESVADILK